MTVQIFDGHNDTIGDILKGRSFFEESSNGHIDLPRARKGGLAGGFFACWVSNPDVPPPDLNADPTTFPYASEANMPPIMPVEYAQHQVLAQLSGLLRIAKESEGEVRIVKTTEEMRQAFADGAFAIEMHIEGAEPLDPSLNDLDVFYEAGVRSLGLVWSRPNAFGNGVPFQFGHSPDTGAGLTDAGKALVKACNQLGIMLDMSHLNEKGFWDVASISTKPIVATHSGAWSLANATRNLTDRQLDAIKESNGVVGVVFATGFLNPEGQHAAESTSYRAIADHLDYITNRIGIDHVAFGSDFDGATIPGDLEDVSADQLVIEELRNRGYDDADLNKIGTGNWLRVLEATW